MYTREFVKRGIRNTEYGTRNKESADYRLHDITSTWLDAEMEEGPPLLWLAPFPFSFDDIEKINSHRLVVKYLIIALFLNTKNRFPSLWAFLSLVVCSYNNNSVMIIEIL